MIKKARSVYDRQYSGFTQDRSGNWRPGETDSRLKDKFQRGYVELIGVTNPQSLSDIPTEPKPDTKGELSSLVYEYSWSVGMTGTHSEWYQLLDENDPIVVQMLLHTDACAYSIREVAANLKQIPPYKKTGMQKIEDWMELLRPLTQTTGEVMETAGLQIPGKIVSAISGMKLNSVPVDQFPWFIKTFSWGIHEGIEWHIPKSLIDYTGNRLEGSLGVYFINCESSVPEAQGKPCIELRAFLRSSDQRELFISPTNTQTMLELTPQ